LRMTILLTKDLIAVAIIVLVVAIAAMSERQAKRPFWRRLPLSIRPEKARRGCHARLFPRLETGIT
jgi:hypothetical protein